MRGLIRSIGYVVLALICAACCCVAAGVAENSFIVIVFPSTRDSGFTLSESAFVLLVSIIAAWIFAVLMVHAIRGSRQRPLDAQRGFPVEFRQ